MAEAVLFMTSLESWKVEVKVPLEKRKSRPVDIKIPIRIRMQNFKMNPI